MAYEVLTTTAAFGGFLIAVCNIVYTVWRDSPRKGILEANIVTAKVRSLELGYFDFALDVELKVEKSEIYFKEAKLIAPDDCLDPVSGKRDVPMYKGFPSLGYNLLESKGSKDLKERCSKITDWFSMPNFSMKKGESKLVSYVGGIPQRRAPDGFDDFVLCGWRLEIETSTGKFITNFDFKLDHSDLGVSHYRESSYSQCLR